jgi:hypothetical protein
VASPRLSSDEKPSASERRPEREIMDILTKALSALWQVLLVGLLLGAGLPALFALGLRSLNTCRVVVDAGSGGASAASSKPSPLGLTGAVVCFTVVVLAAAFGIVVIIFGNQLFG